LTYRNQFSQRSPAIRPSGDKQIVAANRSADLFEPGADLPISRIGRCGEREHVKRAEHHLELSREPWRSLFRSSVAQFCRDDGAGADLRFTDPADVFGYPALRVADEVGNDIGIEQVTHQNSTGSGGASAIGGNSSSSGARVAVMSAVRAL
jgi:hypothetical protein